MKLEIRVDAKNRFEVFRPSDGKSYGKYKTKELAEWWLNKKQWSGKPKKAVTR